MPAHVNRTKAGRQPLTRLLLWRKIDSVRVSKSDNPRSCSSDDDQIVSLLLPGVAAPQRGSIALPQPQVSGLNSGQTPCPTEA